MYSFNTQPPEGGWFVIIDGAPRMTVSTHSRPKAAGAVCLNAVINNTVSTHSRPKAAGRLICYDFGL